MKIVRHQNNTYSITGLTREDVRDLENGLAANRVPFLKAAESTYVPSGYPGWTLENYRSINAAIAARLDAMSEILHPVAYNYTPGS